MRLLNWNLETMAKVRTRVLFLSGANYKLSKIWWKFVCVVSVFSTHNFHTSALFTSTCSNSIRNKNSEKYDSFLIAARMAQKCDLYFELARIIYGYPCKTGKRQINVVTLGTDICHLLFYLKWSLTCVLYISDIPSVLVIIFLLTLYFICYMVWKIQRFTFNHYTLPFQFEE